MNKIIDLLGLSEFKEKIISLIPTKVSQLDNDSEYAKKEEINDLKKSVSDGKTLVASAITDKGIQTAANATFAMIAENIGQISGNTVNLQESKTVQSFVGDMDMIITPEDGFDGFSELLIEGIEGQSKSVTPTATIQTIKPDSGKALIQVTVNAMNLQEKTVSPSATAQTVTPDTGKNGLSKVTVNAAPLQAKIAIPSASEQAVNPDSGQYGLSQVIVKAVDLQEKTVSPTSSNQTIYADAFSGKFSALKSVTVNAAKLQNKSVTPTSSIQTIYPDSGFYGLGAVSVGAINTSELKMEKGSFISGAKDQTIRLELGFKPSFILVQSSNSTTGWVTYNEFISTTHAYTTNKSDTGANRLLARKIGENYTPIYLVDSNGWTFIVHNSSNTFVNALVKWMACGW